MKPVFGSAPFKSDYLEGEIHTVPFDNTLWVEGEPRTRDTNAKNWLTKNGKIVRSTVHMKLRYSVERKGNSQELVIGNTPVAIEVNSWKRKNT